MPVIKSARKKLRQDKKRTALNKKLEDLFEKLAKQAKKSPTEKNVKMAISAVDKAAKKNIIHKNKAARLKSSLSKLSKKTKRTDTKTKPASKPAPWKKKLTSKKK